MFGLFVAFELISVATSNAGPIHQAAESGDLDQVKMLLKSDPGLLNRGDENEKMPPLLWAASGGKFATAEYLISAGADLKARTMAGLTLLDAAIVGNNRDLVELVIKRGANVNEIDSTGDISPLVVAATKGYSSIAEMLLVKGADPSFRAASTGMSILQFAILRDEVEVAGLLLKYGADINATDKTGFTPLMEASKEGNIEIVNLLLAKHPNLEAKGIIGGDTALHLAAYNGRLDVAKALVKHGANSRALNDLDHATPAMEALAHGFPEVTHFLLQAESH